MKKLLTFFFLLFTLGLLAQAPANDDCGGIIDLGEAPFCPDDVFFDNVEATPSDIGNDNIPDINECTGLGPMENDVWFSFIASDTIDDYTITVTGITDGMGSTPMLQPQVAVYRGDICGLDELELLDCGAADLGESVATLDLTGLDAGLTYFVRITDYSATGGDNEGTFQLCIKKKDPIVIVDDDIITNLCFGEVFDSGGPDGNYGPNENYTFSIQPSDPFVECIYFTLEYFNIDNAFDAITFYNGPSTSSPVISTITGGNFSDEGGGGVCYTVVATSGQLTMQIETDGSVQLDGFAGSWECSQQPCEPADLVSVTVGADAQTIIDAISTPLTQATITDINCPNASYGTFDATDNTNLGLNKGLLLTSGSVTGVANPGTFFTSTNNGAPGDEDLDIISQQSGNGSASQNACIIELDVFAATDELTFEYVFGSEEYPEFVNTSFNDIFAFLISGPGIVGDPGLGAQKNIAVLPAPASVPVQINSVNNLLNWEYYRNNADGPSVAYDGLTSDYLGVKKSLTAFSEVTPCNTYHLKLAVADRGDGSYDSGVFISELQGGVPTLEVVYNNGINYLVEECIDAPDEIVIGLDADLDQPITYDVVVMGTATPGADYTLNLPSSITFSPGMNSFTFPIEALTDGITEGVETIEIMLTNDFGCGIVDLATITIEIYDQLDVQIFAGEDTSYICAGNTLQMEVTGASNYIWSPAPVFITDTDIPNPIAQPVTSQNVFVVGFLGVCSAVDTIYLNVVDPEVSIDTIGTTGLCQGESVSLLANNNVGDTNFMWTTSDNTIDPTDPTITVSPNVTTTYIASVNVVGCSAADTVVVNVDPFNAATVIQPATICENYSIVLADTIVNTSTTFEWSPDLYLDNANISNATATPDETTTYTLISTSASGFCADTSSVTITVTPADVEIILPTTDTVEICLGESVDLNTLTTTPGMNLLWSPNDGSLDTLTLDNVVATPTQSTTYLATLSVGACIVYDSIFVRVDSLPPLGIGQLIPDKEKYCEGELVTIVSQTVAYEPSHFPDLTVKWEPPIGFQTPDTLWNLVINAVVDTTYLQIVENNGCMDTTAVPIQVIPLSSLVVTPEQTTICAGESVDLLVTSAFDLENIVWSPSSSLSCDDCTDPTATPGGTTTYTVNAEVEGCPTEPGVAEVEVVQLPEYEFPLNTSICENESIQLNISATFDPDATYNWLVNGTVVQTGAYFDAMPTETTTYTLEIFKPGCGTTTDMITVFVLDEEPVVTISDDITICIGESVTLTADADVSGVFTWSPGDEMGSSITVSPGSQTDYTVSFESGCFIVEETVTVFVSQGFTIDSILAIPADTVYEGAPVTLEVFTTPSALSNPTYEWSLDGTVFLDTTANPITVIAPSVDGETTVGYSVVVTDDIGCSATDMFDMVVLDSEWEIPNAFTPDGDNNNDRFKVVKNEAITIIEFQIFNRWGQMVYNHENGDDGWDGQVDGEPAPTDVYIYRILLEYGDGTEVDFKGEVTLIR